MGKAWSAYEAVIDNFLNKDFLVHVLVLFLAQLLAFGLFFVVAALTLVGFGLLFLPSLVLLVPLAGLGFIALGALCAGLLFNFGLSQLEKNKVDWRAALKNTLDHLFNAMKVQALVALAVALLVAFLLLIAGATFLRSLLPVLAAGHYSPADLLQPLAGAFGGLLLLVVALVAAGFLASPFLLLLNALPFAEGTGARATFRRAWELGRANYWNNLKLVALNHALSQALTLAFLLLCLLLVAPVLALTGLGGLGFALDFFQLMTTFVSTAFVLSLHALFLARLYLFDAHA